MGICFALSGTNIQPEASSYQSLTGVLRGNLAGVWKGQVPGWSRNMDFNYVRTNMKAERDRLVRQRSDCILHYAGYLHVYMCAI